jgi:hypothetical protein
VKLFAVAYRASIRIVESNDATSTSNDSAAARLASGSSGALIWAAPARCAATTRLQAIKAFIRIILQAPAIPLM